MYTCFRAKCLLPIIKHLSLELQDIEIIGRLQCGMQHCQRRKNSFILSASKDVHNVENQLIVFVFVKWAVKHEKESFCPQLLAVTWK